MVHIQKKNLKEKKFQKMLMEHGLPVPDTWGSENALDSTVAVSWPAGMPRGEQQGKGGSQ